MVNQNNQDQPKEVDLFSAQAEFVPIRETDSDDEGGAIEGAEPDGHESLEDRMESARKLSDFQTLSKVLNPDFGYKHLNLIAMGRTFPDVYNSLFIILVKDLIKKSLAEKSKLSVAEAIAIVNTALSKSIDGEGIIDNIVAYTKGHQETDTTTQIKTGLP